MTPRGRRRFEQIGCAACHVPDLPIDARPARRRRGDGVTIRPAAIFNGLFATATPLHERVDDGSGLPGAASRRRAAPFLVRNIFTDFKRHDLGPDFHERNYDGTIRNEFMTTPLWGVGSTAPYGHDGRSITLEEVILRHGGEAQAARDAFAG